MFSLGGRVTNNFLRYIFFLSSTISTSYYNWEEAKINIKSHNCNTPKLFFSEVYISCFRLFMPLLSKKQSKPPLSKSFISLPRTSESLITTKISIKQQQENPSRFLPSTSFTQHNNSIGSFINFSN